MQGRILHIKYDPESHVIIAGGFDGIMYEIGEDLRILRQSVSLPKIGGLYVIAIGSDFIYGRDYGNNLVQLCKKTLRPIRVVNLEKVASEKFLNSAFSPIPTVSHGLHYISGKLFVNNAFGELLDLDPDNLSLKHIWNVPSNSFVESISGSMGGKNEAIISDCTGHIMCAPLFETFSLKSRDSNLELLFRLDTAPVHKIAYDSRYDRYWMTTDSHGGFSLVEPFSQSIQRVYLTRDCTEWVELSPDASIAAVACFDHYLYVFDNDIVPRIKAKIGPFKFQLKQVSIKDNENAFVLLESGEIFKVSLTHGKIENYIFGSDCIWDMQLSLCDSADLIDIQTSVGLPKVENKIFYCATESGFIAQVRIQFTQSDVYLEEICRSPKFRFGRIRRVISISQSEFVACATAQVIFRAALDGRILWKYEGGSIPREIVLHPNGGSCFAVFESGLLVELDLQTGVVLWKHRSHVPLWSIAISDGLILVGTRHINLGDQGLPTTLTSGCIDIWEIGSRRLLRSLPVKGNVKRLKPLQDNKILMMGNGEIGASIFDIVSGEFLKTWSDFQLNTCEDAVIQKGNIHAITYGFQINSYLVSGDTLASQFIVDNFPKVIQSVEAHGKDYLIVAGRTGYIAVFSVDNGIPSHSTSLYISNQ